MGFQVVQEVLHVVKGLWTFPTLVLALLVTFVGVALVLQVLGQGQEILAAILVVQKRINKINYNHRSGPH